VEWKAQNLPWSDALKWCDVILFMEDYHPEWIPTLAGCQKFKVMWSMDTHMVGDAHLAYAKAQRCTLFLTAVYGWTATGTQLRREWFPNTYPDELFVLALGKKVVSRDVVTGYLGNPGTEERVSWITRLQKDIDMVWDKGIVGDEMVMRLMHYQIAWNRNIRDDINARTFEATAAGCMLLTNETPGLRELFEIGKEVVVYDSYEDWVEKARYYIIHPLEEMNIARAGMLRCRRDHTDDERARRLVELLGKS
jgi:glycosyltransferase involved in cell wall biosynthesis